MPPEDALWHSRQGRSHATIPDGRFLAIAVPGESACRHRTVPAIESVPVAAIDVCQRSPETASYDRLVILRVMTTVRCVGRDPKPAVVALLRADRVVMG